METATRASERERERESSERERERESQLDMPIKKYFFKWYKWFCNIKKTGRTAVLTWSFKKTNMNSTNTALNLQWANNTHDDDEMQIFSLQTAVKQYEDDSQCNHKSM